MNLVSEIKEEHRQIEREFIELETIRKDSLNSEINYPNLIHILKKIVPFWDKHEEKERIAFNILEKNGFKIPVEEILSEHKLIAQPIEKIKKAINSGDDFKVKKTLEKDVMLLISKLRAHIEKEDEILFSLPREIQMNI